jgi:hypothetical protein
MKNTIKQICFLILVLALTVNYTDYSFIGNYFLYNQVEAGYESSDFSNHFCSHSVYCEDDNFINYSKVMPDIFLYRNDFSPLLRSNFKHNYIPDIWLPPKFS